MAQSRQNTGTGASAEAARDQVERMMEQGRDIASSAIDQGTEQVRQASDMSRTATAAGAMSAMRSGSAVAEGMDQMAQAWSTYARDVMQRTTDASQAMMRCKNLTDVLGVQADLMRGHMEAFLGHSSKVAELTSRIAMQSFQSYAQPGKDKGSTG